MDFLIFLAQQLQPQAVFEKYLACENSQVGKHTSILPPAPYKKWQGPGTGYE